LANHLDSPTFDCHFLTDVVALNPPTRPITVGFILSAPIREYLHIFDRLSKRSDIKIRVYFIRRGTRQLPENPGYEFTILETETTGRPDSFYAARSGKLPEIIRHDRCDVWLIGGWNRLCYWQAVWACQRLNRRYVVRGTSHLAKDTSWWRSGLKALGLRVFFRQAAGFLAVGKLNEDLYHHYSPTIPVFRVPQFFDESRLLSAADQAHESPAEVRTRFGFSATDFVILFVGRLAPEKNLFELLRAIVELSKKGISARLLIVGQGPLREELGDFIRRHQIAAVFAGQVLRAELPPLFKSADTLVLPSSSEPWGFVVAEAMTLGVPPIVSDRIGCAPELIIQYQTGIVYPHGNIASLTKKLHILATNRDLCRDIGERARRHLRETVTVSRTVELLVTALTEVSRLPLSRSNRLVRRISSQLKRWAAVSPAERRLLIRAIANLGIARFRVKHIPFDRLISTPRVPQDVSIPPTPEQIESARLIGWAVCAMSRYTPWESKCLAQGLAAHEMLSLEGIPSTLHLGVDKATSGELEAHAWLECGSSIVTGNIELQRYRQIASFPQNCDADEDLAK
jgi:glycosyltransferase involved in cell wall biosynthesis